MSIWSLTYQQSVFKRYHSYKHFSEFLPTRWRQKSTGVDTEQNDATVTLCIGGGPDAPGKGPFGQHLPVHYKVYIFISPNHDSSSMNYNEHNIPQNKQAKKEKKLNYTFT